MSVPTAAANTYDEVAFPCQPVPQSHPDRLAAVAILFGLQPPPILDCRVLELGCASGGNLIPMAEQLPQSQFVGVDYSGRQIAAGRQTVAKLGLPNIELWQADIRDLDEQLGTFDYIIGHGIFSWVDVEVQEKILVLCKSLLRPNGLAYVSYNIYPGWHVHNIIRELACHASPAAMPPLERAAKARELLTFFSETLPEHSPHGRLLKEEIDVVLGKPDGYLLHEHMEIENHPLYFHEFVARASAMGLDYVGDCAPATMFTASFGPQVDAQIQRIAKDIVSVEQHLDLLRNRSFRQSIFCHRGVPMTRQLEPSIAERLYFATSLHPASPPCNLGAVALEQFVTPHGGEVWIPSPVSKAACWRLGEFWPRALRFDELAASAAAMLGRGDSASALSAQERELLGRDALQMLCMGLADIHADHDRFVTTISASPVARPYARLQATESPHVTNQRHRIVTLDDVNRNLLRSLDGTRDRAALVKMLVEAAERGEITILKNALPASGGQDVPSILEGMLDRCLGQLARNALLVA